MKIDRILISAVIFSVAWHIFWLSAVNVVSRPRSAKSVKFSSVSFLGPILERGTLNVSVAPHELSTEEKEYLSYLKDSSGNLQHLDVKDSYVKAQIYDSSLPVGEEEPVNLIISAIDGQKTEPGRDID